jgi:hypothetical protein
MRFSGLGRSKSGLAQNHATDDSPRLLLYTVVYSMRLVAESRTDWDVACRRARAYCASDGRRRVPRTFWCSNDPRADAVAPCRAMGRYLIQMGVWCASATDVQPRERKTGCAWRDDGESSDASTRQRFRAPLDKGSVNGRPLSDPQQTDSHKTIECVRRRPQARACRPPRLNAASIGSPKSSAVSTCCSQMPRLASGGLVPGERRFLTS